MLEWAQRLLADDDGQDLIEYTLLMCFIAIACMWFVSEGHDPVTGIWTNANRQVTNAQAAATGGG